MNNSTLNDFSKRFQTRVNTQLTELLSPSDAPHDLLSATPPVNDLNNPLSKAMLYSLMNGGKRIRPILLYATAMAVRCQSVINYQPSPAEDAFAVAIELIHSYSLIHDDLPAMDDDDLRRGVPTCHIQFDEATAILAGDALQCLAFEIMSNLDDIPARTCLKAIHILASGAGNKGMVMGQAIDLAHVNKPIEIAELEHMHNLKTGALIEAAVLLGATANDASEAQLLALQNYAKAIGLAFQVYDDILDVTADTQTLGKTQGSDIKHSKPTYVSLLGLEGAQEKAYQLRDQAHLALAQFDHEANILRFLASFIVERSH